jgi:[ribosomal protein S5]-alanine N-acetyltransferase
MMEQQQGGTFAYLGLPIQTERLVIRCMARKDLEPLYKLNSDPEVMRYVGRGQPWTREFTEQIIGPIIANSNNHILDWVTIAEKKSNKFVGIVCLLRLPEIHRAQVGGGPYIEVGWRILWEHWNQGYATEAATAVVDYGFKVRDLKELACIVDERNARSLRVVEKLGFQHMRTYSLNGQTIRFHWSDQQMFQARHERLKPRST